MVRMVLNKMKITFIVLINIQFLFGYTLNSLTNPLTDIDLKNHKVAHYTKEKATIYKKKSDLKGECPEVFKYFDNQGSQLEEIIVVFDKEGELIDHEVIGKMVFDDSVKDIFSNKEYIGKEIKYLMNGMLNGNNASQRFSSIILFFNRGIKKYLGEKENKLIKDILRKDQIKDKIALRYFFDSVRLLNGDSEFTKDLLQFSKKTLKNVKVEGIPKEESGLYGALIETVAQEKSKESKGLISKMIRSDNLVVSSRALTYSMRFNAKNTKKEIKLMLESRDINGDKKRILEYYLKSQ